MEINQNRLIFKDYENFKAIIEEGGVSKAAEKLFISQSAVSKYLKRLEDSLGLELFNRKSYPVRLTEAGELYLKYVNQIFELEKEFRTNIAEWKEGVRGVIKIGVAFFHSSIFFPVVLPEFNKNYPDIRIKAYEGSSQEIITMLDQEKVDMAIFQLPCSYSNIVFEHLIYERILFVVNRNNPLIQNIDFDPKQKVNKISNDDFLRFSNEPFVLMKKNQNSRQLVQNYFYKLSFKPKIALETSNVNTIANLVKTGMVVAFIPGLILKFKEQAEELLFFYVEDPILQRELGIAYKATNTLTKQHKLFIETAKKLIHD